MSNQEERRSADSGQSRSYREQGAQPYSPKRKRRRVKKTVKRTLVLLMAVVIMLGMAWAITGMIQNTFGGFDESGAVIPSSLPISLGLPSDPASAVDQPILTIPNATDNTGWNFIGPVQQDPAAMQILQADRRMIAQPENGRVDMAYFDTTVFVGDSITQGLFIYPRNGIPNAKYCAYLGVSPRGIYDGSMQKRNDGTMEVPMDTLVSYQPDNVYILLGTNAMVGMGDEALLGYYDEMLNVMRERLHPEVSFYVQSITPVLQGRDARFDFDRINNLNDQLAKMAHDKGMYFLDLHEALAGDDGWLRAEYGGRDGYHMTPAGYSAWVEYLVTHTAYNPRHAHLYLEGSHYYSQLPPPEAA